MYIIKEQLILSLNLIFYQIHIVNGFKWRVTPKENFPVIIHVFENGGKTYR